MSQRYCPFLALIAEWRAEQPQGSVSPTLDEDGKHYSALTESSIGPFQRRSALRWPSSTEEHPMRDQLAP